MGPNPGRGVSGSVRRLHVVEYAADQGGFVLSTRRGAKTGSFVLVLDEELLAEVAKARRGPDEVPEVRREAPQGTRRPGTSSALSPREIQARLRAGHSMEEVALEAGVAVDWVDRFAAPVMAEQAAAIERAGRAVLLSPRKGPSDRPLEGSVRRNLAERGAVMGEGEFQEAWAARQLVDADWVVSFQFRSRGRVMTAEWVLNLANGALTTHNRLGADLGYIEPADRPTAGSIEPEPISVPAPRPPARTRSAAAGKAPAKAARARKAPAREVATRVTAPRKATAQAPTAQKAAADSTATPKPASPAPKPVAPAPKPAIRPAPVAATKPAVRRTPAEPVIPPRQRALQPPASTEVAASRKPAPRPKVAAPPEEAPRRVAAAPRQATISSLSLPVLPAPEELPPPEGAHFARRPRPPRIRANRAAAPPDQAEPPRLPLADFDAPDDRGSRFGNPE